MSHETGPLDISDRLTMASNVQPKPSEWTEIGQAEVVHTIFGKAKVRIIRKHDKVRRLFFLLASVAIAVMLWQGWVLFQRYEPVQSIYSYFHSSSNDDVNFLVASPEKMPSQDTSVIPKIQSKNILENASNTVDVELNNKPPQPQTNIGGGKIVAKQVVQRPLGTVKPQSGPYAASNVATMNQANKVPLHTQAPKTLYPKTPLPSGVVQGSTESPAVAAPLEVPLSKEDAVVAPAGDNQPADNPGSKQ